MQVGGTRRNIGDYMSFYGGLGLAILSVITFLYLLPSTLSSSQAIAGMSTEIIGIQGVLLSSIIIYSVLVLTALFALVSLFSLFAGNITFSMGFEPEKKWKFFHYFVIFILVQLILSQIISYFVPNFGTGFPYNQGAGVQNFVFSFLTVEESVIFELIPLSIAVIIASAMKGKISIRALLHYDLSTAEVLIIAVLIAASMTIIIGGDIIALVTDFITFFMLNVIFLQFGFLKAFLTNFAITLTNVTATLIAGNTTIGILFSTFLFFLGFLGIYSLVQIGISAPRPQREPVSESAPQQSPQPRRGRVTIEPFIRSRCPDCGNTVFHLTGDMNLKCSKCGKELDKDSTGEENIRIEIGGPSRYQINRGP